MLFNLKATEKKKKTADKNNKIHIIDRFRVSQWQPVTGKASSSSSSSTREEKYKKERETWKCHLVGWYVRYTTLRKIRKEKKYP